METLKLGDKEFTLPKLTLNVLIRIEDRLGWGLKDLQSKLETDQFKTIRAFAHAILVETNPKLTEEEIGDLITPENMASVLLAYSKTLNKKKA